MFFVQMRKWNFFHILTYVTLRGKDMGHQISYGALLAGAGDPGGGVWNDNSLHYVINLSPLMDRAQFFRVEKGRGLSCFWFDFPYLKQKFCYIRILHYQIVVYMLLAIGER